MGNCLLCPKVKSSESGTLRNNCWEMKREGKGDSCKALRRPWRGQEWQSDDEVLDVGSL